MKHDLTDHQFAIAEQIANGLTAKQAAKHLDIKLYAVKDGAKAIYKKLGVHGRHEMAKKLFNKKIPKFKRGPYKPRPKRQETAPKKGTPLSDTEQHILDLLFSDMSVSDVAEDMDITHQALNVMIRRAVSKVGANNIVGAYIAMQPDFKETNKHLVDTVVPDLERRLHSAEAHDGQKQSYISKLETDLRSAKTRIDRLETDLDKTKESESLGWNTANKVADERNAALETKPTHCSLCSAAIEQMNV